MIAAPGDIPAVLQAALASHPAEVRGKAEHALYTLRLKVPDPAQRSAPIRDAYAPSLDSSARECLLQVLAMLADPAAYRVVASAYQDPVPEVRDTALRLLVHWPDASPAPLLLDVFRQTTNGVYRTLALRGLVTQATLWTEERTRSPGTRVQPPAEAVEWLTAAQRAIGDDADEKRLLISGLGDLNCMAGLQLLQPYLDDPALGHDAALALVRASKDLVLPEEKQAARPLLEKIIATTKDANLRKPPATPFPEVTLCGVLFGGS